MTTQPANDQQRETQARTDASTRAKKLKRFPEFPPREDMNNPWYLTEPGYQGALKLFFGNNETTFVLSETPLSWEGGERTDTLIPDLLVAFDVQRHLIQYQRGYAITTHGKPPAFVQEVASGSTRRRDNTDKRQGYQAYGVPEYWRFDPRRRDNTDKRQGYQDYGVPEYWRFDPDPPAHSPQNYLAGDRLVNGIHQPIAIEAFAPNQLRGYSEALGLYLCYEDDKLRFYDPVREEYLRTHVEEGIARQQAEQARQEATARQQAEQAHQQAEEALQRAEQARQQEAAARQRAEAEIARLAEEIHRLRGE